MDGETLRTEIVLSPVTPTLTTGGEGRVPEVAFYAVTTVQRAALKRAKDD